MKLKVFMRLDIVYFYAVEFCECWYVGSLKSQFAIPFFVKKSPNAVIRNSHSCLYYKMLLLMDIKCFVDYLARDKP